MKILLLFILFILSCDSDSNPVSLPEDCAGVVGGTAYIDECDVCVSGSTSLEPCEQDCKGEWGGNAEDIDEDGICDDVDDCIGEYDGCGVCNGDDLLNDYCYCDGSPISGYCNCDGMPTAGWSCNCNGPIEGYCNCNGNICYLCEKKGGIIKGPWIICNICHTTGKILK